MTHSPASDFSPFPLPARRRHEDPSGLWSRVWSGSVVLHVVLLLAVLPSLKTAVERARGGGAATPIELVDVGAIAPDTAIDPAIVPTRPAETETPASPPASVSPSVPVPVAPPPAPAPAAIPPAVLAPAPVETSPPSAIAPSPTPTPAITPTPTPALTPTPTSTPQPLPSPLVPVQPSPYIPPVPPPVLGRSPLPSPVPFPDSPNAEQPDPAPPLPAPLPAPPTPGSSEPDRFPGEGDTAANPAPDSGAPGIDTPASDPDSGAGDDLGEVVIGRQPTPTSLTLSVVNVRYLSPQETADIPEENAKLLTSNIDITADPTQPSSCPLFPDSVADFGASVTLRLTVEADGQVSRAEVQQPAPTNSAYASLVQCLAQTSLQFRPALDGGIERASDNTVVEVRVVGD